MSDLFTPDGHISVQQVREELLASNRPSLTEDEVNNIIEPFWFQDLHACFISIPSVFIALKKYLMSHDDRISRINFYEFYIHHLLDESSQLNELHRIGLKFESLQKNDFDKTLFDQITGELQLEKITLEWLIEQKLVVSNASGYSWMHHTITEYLAADFISQQDNLMEVANKFIILHIDEDNSDNIKPSWTGVIKFLLESSAGIAIQDWLLDVINSNPENLTEDMANILATFGRADIDIGRKKKLFDTIYDTYQSRRMWLPVWARKELVRFYTPDQMDKIKIHLERTQDEVETYTHRGNAVAVADQLIQKGIIVDTGEKKSWKEKFIAFALDDNENGVLQRHSLDALEQFKEDDGQLIIKLGKLLESKDTLVKDAYIQYCYASAPNTKEAIDVMVSGILTGSNIYGRHGLYEITTVGGFAYFIDCLIEKPNFLHKFIDDESIFSGDRKEGDNKLVKKLLDAASQNESLKTNLNLLIITALKNEHLYHHKESFFLRNIAIYLSQEIENIFSWIIEANNIEDVGKKRMYLFNLESIVPETLTAENWRLVYDKLGEVDEDSIKRYQEGFIYALRFRKTTGGQEIFDIASSVLGYILPTPQEIDNKDKEREDEIYKEFKFKLEPEKNQFITDIFEYYLENKEIINKKWTDNEHKRMLYLSYKDGIKRIDPKDFTVKFEEKKHKGGRFTWSRQATFYGDMIKVIQLLEPKHLQEPKVRRHIINFIPYTFSEDRALIEEVVKSPTLNEIKWLHRVFKNKEDDRRYLAPESYIYFIENLHKQGNNVETATRVLRSFLLDENIDGWVQSHALRLLSKLEANNEKFAKFLRKIFRQTTHRNVKEEANGILIMKFNDEQAILWRFEELKKRMAPFDNSIRFGVHEVGALENELDEKSFISPLINSKNSMIFEKFIALLNDVVIAYKADQQYQSYLQYIWSSLLIFIAQFNKQKFFEFIHKCEDWIATAHLDSKKNVYLNYHLEKARGEFVNKIAVEGET